MYTAFHVSLFEFKEAQAIQKHVIVVGKKADTIWITLTYYEGSLLRL